MEAGRRHARRLRAARGARGDRPAARQRRAAWASSTAIAPAPAFRSARWWPWCGRGSKPCSTRARCCEVFEVPLGFLMNPANHQKGLARVARAATFLLCHALSGPLHLGRHGRHAQEHAREAVVAMIRVVIENILLFLLPTAMYVGLHAADAPRHASAGAVVNDAPLMWLFVAGALLVAARWSTMRPSRRAAGRARSTSRRTWARTGASSPAS